MTDEEINIAIAETLGLFKIQPLRRTTRKGKLDPSGVVLWYCEEHHGGAATYARVPNYCNDLNACHEVEVSLDDAKHDSFQQHLLEIISPKTHWSDMAMTRIVSATARQRAEAFLRTLNLWQA